MDNEKSHALPLESKSIHFLYMAFLLLVAIAPVYAQMNWNCVTDTADFGLRDGHGSLVFNDMIWVVNGKSTGVPPDSSFIFDDIWYSSNGSEWIMATDSASFPMRTDISLVDFNDAMWALGGAQGC